MSRNQQIQNFIDALEQATGVSIDSASGETGAYGAVTASTTPTEVLSANTSRRSVLIQNLSETVDAYVGFDSSVSGTDGVLIPADGGVYADDSYAGALYVVTPTDTADVRYQEVSE